MTWIRLPSPGRGLDLSSLDGVTFRKIMTHPSEFKNVTALVKANVYFDGKVVSHTILSPDGSKRTLGLLYPGTFRFDTGAPERMEITAGSCRARLPGDPAWKAFAAGTYFNAPGKSAFDIAVDAGICEYVCSFLPEEAP